MLQLSCRTSPEVAGIAMRGMAGQVLPVGERGTFHGLMTMVVGIRAINIIPLDESPGFAGWKAARPDEYAEYCKSIPVGYVGDCEKDLGRVVAFLCSEEGRYVNGTSVTVDGGRDLLR